MNDVYLLRLVVISIAAAMCISIIGIVVVAATGHQSPESLTLIATSTVTALVALLVPTGRAPQENGKASGGEAADLRPQRAQN